MEVLVNHILLFFLYAFFGWCLEVICKIIELKKFVNRGFLIGPICSIYGFGVLGILFINYNSGMDVLAVFLKSMLVCSILEYFTSWFMEVFFKARWWDYSNRKFNINGRVCLETMTPFGLLGVIVVYLVNPIVSGIISIFPYIIQLIVCICLLVIFIIDNIVSIVVVSKIKHEIKSEAKDNTEYVREKVFDFIENNSYIYRRIKLAYPGFDVRGKLKIVEDQIVENVLITNDKITIYKKNHDEKRNKVKEKIKEYNVKTREIINKEKLKKKNKFFK